MDKIKVMGLILLLIASKTFAFELTCDNVSTNGCAQIKTVCLNSPERTESECDGFLNYCMDKGRA